MEFKKKTIIWEDNNEPPKDYIWVKSDGKAYEYSYSQGKWIESKLIKTEESGGSGDGGGSDSESSLMNLIPNNYPKPDLFLCTKYVEDSSVDIDVTNYKIDDLFNLCDEENDRIRIKCLYESSELDKPIIIGIQLCYGQIVIDVFVSDDARDIANEEVAYNNKTYYYYFENVNPK